DGTLYGRHQPVRASVRACPQIRPNRSIQRYNAGVGDVPGQRRWHDQCQNDHRQADQATL
ncbi:hypothetical protein, partial [Stieleria sp.]|uniref:hypothetical protein n=1 Tax=Stieleria sp. TaxID=2795976 RepID=UPI003561328E